MIDLNQLASFLSDFAGVVALLLSIYVFIITRVDRRPRLSVGVDRETLEVISEKEIPDEPPLDMIFIDIANPSDRRIKVSGLIIECIKRKNIFQTIRQSYYYPDFQTKQKTPFFLVPGDNATYSTETDELCYWLTNSKGLLGDIKLRAIVRDGTGNKYKSKWINLFLEIWSKI